MIIVSFDIQKTEATSASAFVSEDLINYIVKKTINIGSEYKIKLITLY